MEIPPGSGPGVGEWLPTAINATGGQYYSYSEWYRSNRPTQISAAYTDAGGVEHYSYVFAAVPASTDWKQFTGGIFLPAGATKLYFYHVLDSVGWLQQDDFSVVVDDSPGFGAGMVSLTFDDGSQGYYDNARPIMNSNGFKSTQYIPSWGLMQTPQDPFLMTPTEIRALAAAGDEIGGHSVTHPSLALCNGGLSGQDCLATTTRDPNNPARYLGAYPDPTQDVPTATTNPKYPTTLDYELTSNKSFLENLLGNGTVVDDFAYPFGEYNDTVIQHTMAAGFKMARSVDVGYNARDFQPMAIKVQNMTSTTTQAEFQSWVDFAKTNKVWLVIVYHEVFPPNDPGAVCPDNPLTPWVDLCFWTTVSNFTNQMNYLKSSGVAVKTMKDAFNTTQGAPLPGMVQLSYPSGAGHPNPADTLTAAASGFTDPNNKPLTYTYTWRVNGTVAKTTANTTALTDTFPLTGTVAGNVVSVTVTASNGTLSASAPAAMVNVVAAPVTGDTVPPTVTITTPAQGATYARRQAVTANYSCADETRLVSCVGTVSNGSLINTNVRGTRRFTVTAKDGANNTTTKTVTYTVN